VSVQAEAPRRPRLRGDERAALFFLAPWLIGLVAFLLIPLVWGVWISLTDEQIVKVGEFVGLRNYEEIVTDDPLFRQALGVTLRWILLTTPLFMIGGLALALLLNQRLPGMFVFRTILFVPAVLSGVAVAVLWVVLLNADLGAVNALLRSVGIDDPPRWLRDPNWAMPAVAIMGLWGIGGSAIIWLAGLQNIPPHLYEAAAIDGAGEWAEVPDDHDPDALGDRVLRPDRSPRRGAPGLRPRVHRVRRPADGRARELAPVPDVLHLSEGAHRG
jgi:multiple sugar transport system permease protein